MKKLFTTLLLAFTVLASYAHDVEVNGIYYNLNSATKEAAVTYKGDSYTNKDYSGSVNIPSTITCDDATYSVTSIEELTFFECSELTSVSIPNSVMSIGEFVFYGVNVLRYGFTLEPESHM